MQTSLLAPVIALVLWSLVMCAWMYATRIPAMIRLKVGVNPNKPLSAFNERLPSTVRWKADNYNHLMEQPTIFYATVLTLAMLGANHPINVGLAWAYVAIRVIHSLVQAIFNHIILRFSLFILSTLVLLALAVHAALSIYPHTP